MESGNQEGSYSSSTSTPPLNHSEHTTISDDRALREYVCLSTGLSLEDFMIQNGGGHNTSVATESFHNIGHNENETHLDPNLELPLPHNGTPVHTEALDFSHHLLSHFDFEKELNASMCKRNYDGVLCWPQTSVGETTTLQCFRELNGILYDVSKNATRHCIEGPDGGGFWDITNYTSCQPVKLNGTINESDSNILSLTTGVYFFGYCLSLAAVTIAIIIFLSFKELRCLRNVIHTHLIVTYILADTMWIITSSTTFTSTSSLPENQNQASGGGQISCLTYILLHYFHLTNFFWMFVEGLYLYVLVVQTFVAKNIKLRVYVAIGWGFPLGIVIGWAIAKWFAHPTPVVGNQDSQSELDEVCVWLVVNNIDWIYKAPVIFTLAANAVFLLQIMWVLITKLRSATNPETQQSMKAAKALVVLMPLLGITYLLMLAGSREPAYEFIRSLLISTQGFLVALLYCFLNGEVRKAVRQRWSIRMDGSGANCLNLSRRRQMRDFSPRSRTESIRLCNPPANNYRNRKRDSASEATTLSTMHSCSAPLNANGNGTQRKLSTTYTNKLYPNPRNLPLKEEPSGNYVFTVD